MFYKQLRGCRTDRGSQLESGREVAGSQQTQKPKAAPQRDSSPCLTFAISLEEDSLLPRKGQAEDIAIPKWPL